ncbi:MAG TPA: MDR family MFS transporter [Candidatus Dormibacteraeota bacterium]|nr:MDR family MFS transporter [Candidatus Dormibacteraeota bacterium]
MNQSVMQLSQRTKLAIVIAVMLGLFLSALDQTVVGTALPTIVTDLGGNNLYVWVVTSYLLTSTITVPIYGKLSDLFGRKLLLIVGISLFLVGSALSGLSQNMGELIFFRGLQGLGAGALFPIALAVIGDLFTPRERGKYQGFFGAVFGLAFLVGPFLGGWITDNISWHWVFYVNLPIGAVALAVIIFNLPNHRREGATPSIDYWGALVFTAAVVPILIGLTEKGLASSSGVAYSWFSWQVGGLLLLGAILTVAFLYIETRVKEPILPLDLFRNRTYAASQTAMFFMSFAFFIAVIFMPRYYQAVRGISATASGYMLWPLLVGLMGTSIGAGLVIARTGKYKLLMVGAMVTMTAGIFLMTQLTATTGDYPLWVWLFVLGIGIGPAMSGYTLVVQNAVPVARLGVATSTLTFIRQIGGTIGLAIAGTSLSSSIASDLPKDLSKAGVPQALTGHLSASSNSSLTGVGNVGAKLAQVLPSSAHPFIPAIVKALHEALAQGIAGSFWIGLVVAVAAVVATFFLKELPLRTTHHDTPVAPTAPDLSPQPTPEEEELVSAG